MRWIQIFMIVISMMDIYPAVAEAGYECEMGFTGAASTLGSFSQFYCWVTGEGLPWNVCKWGAVRTFFSEFFDQISLFFGLVLLSSPKPSITYVKACRLLILFSALESLVGLVYSAIAYWQGASFLTRSNSCAVTPSTDMAAVTADILSTSMRELIYESLSLLFYSGFVWGTFVLVEILKRGGTGDERIAESDVLSIVKREPPKILVLSSAFGVMPLRPAAIAISLGLLGMCLFNTFNNMLRMISWCGSFDMESTWCRWPYGVVSAVDQLLCMILCMYTVRCLLHLNASVKLPHLAGLWGYVTVSSLGFIAGALYLSVEKYPSYWMSGMRSDVWVYFSRFWMAAVLLVLTRSISVLRLAGGVGSEDERNAAELIYENLSRKTDEAASEADSLNDLLGLASSALDEQRSEEDASAKTGPTDRGSVWGFFSTGPEAKPDEGTAPVESSRETSGLTTPTLPIIPAQALAGVVTGDKN